MPLITFLVSTELPQESSPTALRDWIADSLRSRSGYFRAADGTLHKPSRFIRSIRISKETEDELKIF